MSTTIYTSQRSWTKETQGTYSIAIAVKRILAGETVSFDCYVRDKEDVTKMHLMAIPHFGICMLDGRPALRISHNKDLETCGSSSLIASWHPEEHVKDPAYIAAEMAIYLRLQYTDFFIN